MQSKTKRVFIKIFKVLGWITVSIILLLVVVALLIQIPAVQLKLTQKAISFLEKKIGTQVGLKKIHIAFPKNIVLEGIYLEDQQGDTLLYAGKFSVDTDLWALTRNEIQLNDILLENAVAYIDRQANDSAYNFSYILNAFAGDSTALPDTVEQKQWDFSLETLSLKKIRVQYEDLLEGNIANISLGNFEITMDEFDLNLNRFGVEEILLSDTRANVLQTKITNEGQPVEETAPDSSALDLSLKTVSLNNVNIQYEQSALGQLMRVDLGEAKLNAEKIDLINQEIALREIALRETFIAYQQRAGSVILPPQKVDSIGKTSSADKTWKFSLDALDLTNNSLQYYDFTKTQTPGTVDFDHLWVTNLTVDARDILYSSADIKANLRDLSFQEKSGFSIQSFKSKLLVTDHSATLKDFVLLTGNSRLQLQANAGFASLEDIGKQYAKTTFNADINESSINVRDILYFNPTFLDSLPIHLPAKADLRIDAAVDGAVNNLHIDHLVFRFLSDTYLSTSGTVAGLPDVKKMKINIDLNKFYTTKADMEVILPDTLLPDSIAIPSWVNLEGGFKGTTEKAAFNTMLTSDLGTIDVKGKMDLDSTSALRGFDIHAALAEMNVGKILMKPDSVMGTLSMTAYVHSNGLTLEEMIHLGN